MNKINVSFIVFWFIKCIHQTHGSAIIAQLKHNSSNEEKNKFEDQINEILFNILKINKKIRDIHRVNLLHEMLHNLKVIATHNNKMFDEIKAAMIDTEKYNKTLGAIVNLSSEIEEVINVHYQKELNAIEKNNTNLSVDVNEKIDFNDSYEYLDETYTSSEFNDKLPVMPVPPTLYYFLKTLEDFSLKDIMNQLVCHFQRDINNMSDIFKTNKKLELENHKWYPIDKSVFKLENDTRRVHKGSATSVEKYSFMASIHINGVFTCAGSIIRKNFVITAASCLQLSRIKRSSLISNFRSARVGSDYSQRFRMVLPIINVTFHPGFNPEYLSNNLAIARTKGMKFNAKHNVKWVEYERAGTVWSPDDPLTMLGWGDKDTQSINDFDPLSETQLKLYNLDACKEKYSRNFVTDNNFCGGFVNNGNGGCRREVGGPGLIRGVLAGVISFGPTLCGTADAPTVFTHLSLYADWIDSVVTSKPAIRSPIIEVPSYASVPHLDKTPKIITTIKTQPNSYQTTPVQYSEAVEFLSDMMKKLITKDPIKENDFFENNKDLNQRKSQGTPLIIVNPHKPINREISSETDSENMVLDQHFMDNLKNGLISVINERFHNNNHNEKRVNVNKREKEIIKVRKDIKHTPTKTTVSQGKYKYSINDDYETDVSFEVLHLMNNDAGKPSHKKQQINKHENNFQKAAFVNDHIQDNSAAKNHEGHYKHKHRYHLIERVLDNNLNVDIKDTFNKHIETETIPETTMKNISEHFHHTDINPSTRGETATVDFAIEESPKTATNSYCSTENELKMASTDNVSNSNENEHPRKTEPNGKYTNENELRPETVTNEYFVTEDEYPPENTTNGYNANGYEHPTETINNAYFTTGKENSPDTAAKDCTDNENNYPPGSANDGYFSDMNTGSRSEAPIYSIANKMTTATGKVGLQGIIFYTVKPHIVQQYEIVQTEKEEIQYEQSFEMINKLQQGKGIQYSDLKNTVGRSKPKTSGKKYSKKQIFNYNYDLGPYFSRDDNPFRQVVISRNARSFHNDPKRFARRNISNRTFKFVKKEKKGHENEINFF